MSALIVLSLSYALSMPSGHPQDGRPAPPLSHALSIRYRVNNLYLQLTQSNSKSLLQNSLSFAELVDLIKLTLVPGPRLA